MFSDQFYYIFGGIGEKGVYNDMWKYDLVYQRWLNVFMDATIAARYSFSFTSFTFEDNFYFAVVGGKGYTNENDLFDFYL